MTRSLLVFGLVGLAAVVAFESAITPGPLPAVASPSYAVVKGTARLADLEILETVLYHVEESYVEPSRVDFEEMYVSALEAVEERVPVVLFRREPGGTLVHAEIGAFRTTLDVPTVRSRRELLLRLEEVGALLGAHLTPADIPGEFPEPYARVEYAMVDGVLGTLDPHSVLLPPEEAREMDIDNDGEYGGLGITVEEHDGRLLIESVRPGDPADLAGLRAGDHVVRIDGRSTVNQPMSRVLETLRGPVGAAVELDVRPVGATAVTHHRVERATIRPDPVASEVLDGGVLLIQIPSFHDNVAGELAAAIEAGRRSPTGIKGVILDLRGNPGGYLTQATAVADAFLASGTVVSTVGPGGRDAEPYLARAPGTEALSPLVVLIDAQSASASEIVAGALRNNDRAVVIGERSFGKGSVQNLWNFADGSKLKLTVSTYLTPGDLSIQSVGIPADVELRPVVAETGALRLAWRERLQREEDLDLHLDRGAVPLADPPYSLSWLAPSEPVRLADGRPDPARDFTVGFARDVVIGARSWRRAEILAGLAPLVERTRGRTERAVEAAIVDLGYDWSSGAPVGAAPVELTLDLGGAELVAGETVPVTVRVRNDGVAPIHRAFVVSESGLEALDGLDWALGRIDPGETRSATQSVHVPIGYGAEVVPVSFVVRDGGGVVDTAERAVTVARGPLPDLVFAWTAHDRGDGDGVPSRGERWEVVVRVENRGDGPTRDPFVRATTEDPGVELIVGSAHPGEPRDADGAACAVEADGWDGTRWVGAGAPVGEPGGAPAVFADGCRHVVPPGGSAETSILLDYLGPTDRFSMDLQVGDRSAYDHASVVRAGFWEAFGRHASVEVKPGQRTGAFEPPVVRVSRRPSLVSEGGVATISGVASDDRGVAHVVVFGDGDKVFFEGTAADEAPVASIPFTATLPLDEGVNRFTVVVTDTDGLVTTTSTSTLLDPPANHLARP